MRRTDAMAARLPQLYRDGELIRGSAAGRAGGVLELPAVQLEVLGEEEVEVQIAHWFNTARTLDEAAALAALLDFVPESWQTLPLFRTWVTSMRDSMLQDGAVTVRGLEDFVEEYTRGFQSATRIAAVPRIDTWSSSPSDSTAALIENPLLKRDQRVPQTGGIEPLFQFQVMQKGLDEPFASFLLRGLASGPEYVPVLVNVTTGQGLVFKSPVPVGSRLWLMADSKGGVIANLEGTDVSSRLFSVGDISPGTPWEGGQVKQPAQAIKLARGANDLWFFPLAHYDALGLDRFLFALPDLLMQQGRWDQSRFDQSLFYQDPAMLLHVLWQETQPAKVSIQLPAGLMLSAAGRLTQAIADRTQLESSLTTGVQKLKAAGVDAAVELRAFHEEQRQREFLRMVLPLVVRENGPVGADRLPDAGGVFEVTTFEGSTFR